MGLVSLSEAGEVLLPFPASAAPVRHARSTILLGSIASLRKAGHFEAYSSALSPAHREALLQAVAGTWIPLDVALAHYRACASLGLTADAEAELGSSTFAQAGSIFGTIMRLGKSAGVTPWTVLPQFQRFWDRGYDGGGIRVLRLGPKEARMDLIQCPLADIRYYRNACRGLAGTVLQLFCQRLYAQEIPSMRAQGSMALRAQWA
jgi:hypothetical protein